MNTDPKSTVSQLHLAADILETGHPWEFKGFGGFIKPLPGTPVVNPVADGYEIRLILATPPDGRPLHNPDNLTAEQVGVGYRLALKGEPTNLQIEHQEYWCAGAWERSGKVYTDTFDGSLNARITYRLPLSVPWPSAPVDPYAEFKAAHAAGKVIQRYTESGQWVDHIRPSEQEPIWFHPAKDLRIKPEAPTFQLPPPPPGMRWHREDGWNPEDLPPGTRPFYLGEVSVIPDHSNVTDRVRDLSSWRTLAGGEIATKTCCLLRTTRPLTFEHAGKQWTYHRPGDPMPCDGGARVHVLFFDDLADDPTVSAKAVEWDWAGVGDIIGWRYADPVTKEVELGPEDVPPFSLLRVSGFNDPWNWTPIDAVDPCFGIRVISKEVSTSHEWLGWGNLKDREINRPRHRDADGNPTLWEPCHKTIPQNG